MIGNAELAPETGIVRDVNARLLSTLRISGRRVVEMAPGAWAVLGRPDRRTRRMMSVDGATVARLLAERKLCLTTDGACVLADGVIAPPPPSLSANAFIAAGRTRRKGDAGKGFLGLAVLARRGQGPLNLRQVKAGLRLIADAELDSNSRGLTMNWDAGGGRLMHNGGGREGAVSLRLRRAPRQSSSACADWRARPAGALHGWPASRARR
jgi:hypothetical protein